MNALKLMFVTLVKNLISMVLGPAFILWALRIAASLTSNKIDDYCVAIIECAYKNDVEGLKANVEKLAEKYRR